jgi:hypothetical protein
MSSGTPFQNRRGANAMSPLRWKIPKAMFGSLPAAFYIDFHPATRSAVSVPRSRHDLLYQTGNFIGARTRAATAISGQRW